MIRPNNNAYQPRTQLERVKIEAPAPSGETDAQVDKRLRERFEILDILTNACISGDTRALIVSGPAGLGKSFQIEKALSHWDPSEKKHSIVKGFVRATGLYKMLYQHREPGQVIVFDDADSIFYDDVALSLLKAVCDTTEKRRVSWLAETNMVDEKTASLIPTTFDFDGTVIFITNLDFDVLIDRGDRLTPHLEALVSRAHYIDLSMKTKQDYLVRIRQVVAEGLLAHLPTHQQTAVTNYIERKKDSLRELSLRMAIKIGNVVKTGDSKWERIVDITCCRSAK